MKKIDWYIIRKFLGTFFLAISLIIVIVIIFDISEKIDDFMEKNAPLKGIIFDYYLNFIPYFINLFSPLFTFIAVIFFTSKLASNTEIVAILSSGISFRRLLVPYLIASFFLALMSFYLANFLIPEANKKRLAFKDIYIEQLTKKKERNIHLQIVPGTFVYLETYSSETNTGYNFSLEKINDKTGLQYKLIAENVQWDSISKQWKINNYFIRTINGLSEEITRGKIMTLPIKLNPKDFVVNVEDYETMNFSQLRKHIRELKLKGSDEAKFYEVEKHRRIAFPFATVVLTMIAVAMSSRKIRGGIGMHLGLGIAFSFAFILFMQVSTVFATFGDMSPLIAVWLPNLIFGILGVGLLLRAQR